jgi:hypothetical protein
MVNALLHYNTTTTIRSLGGEAPPNTPLLPQDNIVTDIYKSNWMMTWATNSAISQQTDDTCQCYFLTNSSSLCPEINFNSVLYHGKHQRIIVEWNQELEG